MRNASKPSKQIELSAVYFCPAHYWHLADSPWADSQLDAVLEMLDFANNYVLNDTTALAGLTWPWASPANDLRDFVLNEARAGHSIKTIGYGAKFHFDITPFEAKVDLPRISARVQELDKEIEEARDDEPRELRRSADQLREESRVRQAQSYILLAEHLSAAYVPERRYGDIALEKYPQLLETSPHKLAKEAQARINHEAEGLHDLSVSVHVPAFLAEAMRNASSPDRIWSTLKELRDSKAAKKYRELVRIVSDNTRTHKERKQAKRELDEQVDAVFSHEGFSGRVPRWIKLTVGLTAGAVSLFFPPAGLAPLAVEAGEGIDAFLRRRANIFRHFGSAANIDLYAELKRLYPNIRFEASHLNFFLTERHFGWSEELNQALYRHL